MEKFKEEIANLYAHSKAIHEKLKNLISEYQINIDSLEYNNQISAEEIKKMVEEVFHVQIPKKGGNRQVFDAKKALSYLLRMYTNLNLNQVAEYVNVSDHSTIVYNTEKCKQLMFTDEVFRKKIEHLQERISKFSIFIEICK